MDHQRSTTRDAGPPLNASRSCPEVATPHTTSRTRIAYASCSLSQLQLQSCAGCALYNQPTPDSTIHHPIHGSNSQTSRTHPRGLSEPLSVTIVALLSPRGLQSRRGKGKLNLNRRCIILRTHLYFPSSLSNHHRLLQTVIDFTTTSASFPRG